MLTMHEWTPPSNGSIDIHKHVDYTVLAGKGNRLERARQEAMKGEKRKNDGQAISFAPEPDRGIGRKMQNGRREQRSCKTNQSGNSELSGRKIKQAPNVGPGN